MVLICKEIVCLQDATEAATKCKTHERQYIRTEKTLTVGKVADLVAAKSIDSCDNSKRPAKRVHKERHCGHCGKTGYNSYTCKVEIEDIDDSNASG